MKKIISLIIIGVLVFSGFSAVALNNDNEKLIFEIIDNERNNERGNTYTHTIIGEFGTATWCGYCRYAHGALKNLYAGSWHPMYYVSLVDDENKHAENRIDELVISGYPTVWWDGDYYKNVGAGDVESAMSAYNTSIISCGERECQDINLDLDVTWNGNAEMDIDVSILNNEDSSYTGHLHVYVTEITSSMGWYDTGGFPYTMAFLDYAYNQDVTISSGNTWSNSKNWDGHNYNNGYGDDFGGISYGNIMVIATIFDDDEEYVDDTTGYRIGDNDYPNTPSNPDPEDGATDIYVETELSWTCSDPDDDVLSYDIYLGESSDPPLLASDIVGTVYNPGTLEFNTKYYWKIVANDPQGGSTSGPIWDFTTRNNDPPNSPSNPNPADGETDVPINTCLSWTCDDPDGDDVTYDVYFGKQGEDMLLVSSNQSSKSYCPEDILEFETRYDWKIVAWDEYGYSTVGTTWYFITEGNLPPNTPSEPNPADGETDVPIEKLIRWEGGDPNEGDKVYYDIYFGTSNPPPLVVENTLQNAYDPGTMNLDTTYYWQIVSEDSSGATTDGPIWHFTTESQANQKPTPPDIDGPSNGKTGTEICWEFHSDDPDNHDIKYMIDWGDGNTEETDYYQSCTPVEVCHTYTEQGTYIIKAIAEDTKEAQSDESTFNVKIPRIRSIHYQILFRLYDRMFNMFPILRNLFGL